MKLIIPILGRIVLAGLPALADDSTAPNHHAPFKAAWSGDDREPPVYYTSPTNDVPLTNHWPKKDSPGLTNWPATNLPPITNWPATNLPNGTNFPPLKPPGSR